MVEDRRMLPEDDIRPELARLSERILRQEQRDYEKLLAEAWTAVESPLPGSKWHNDRQGAEGNEIAEASLAYATEQFQHLMFSIKDHMETLILIMQHQRLLLVPAWTVSRAVLEPVLMSCWLTDPQATSEMRIARSASLLPGVVQGSINQLRKYGSQDKGELPGKLETRSELITYYRDHDFEIIKAKKDGVQTEDIAAVRYGKSKASINHNVTQLANAYLPDDPHLYGILSGAAHGQPWLLNGLSDDTDEAIRAIVGPLLPISDAYTQAVCGYLGTSAHGALARRQFRLVALMTRGSPVRTLDRSSRQTAFGTFSKGLRPDEIT